MGQSERILEAPGLLILTVDAGGVLRYCNPPAAARLRIEASTPTTLWDLADADTARRLMRILDTSASAAVPSRVDLLSRDGDAVPLLITANPITSDDGQPQLRIAGFDHPTAVAEAAELVRTAELLQGFIDASTEAMWCIEYTEPVDVRQPVSEITRQVFENDCHWSMCNRAMARLYNLPDDLDFNHQRVSAYFRRSPENEAFVRQIVESGFYVDSAPSIDQRHDGSLVYVENSVRCHIEDGKMLRMWGTVRDTTKFRAENNRLAQRERSVRGILIALPDAVLVVDKSKRAYAANPAFESTFGWRAAEVLGKDVTHLINLELGSGSTQRWFASAQRRWVTEVFRRDGSAVRCDVRMAPLHDDQSRRFVLVLRPEVSADGSGRSRTSMRKERRSSSAVGK